MSMTQRYAGMLRRNAGKLDELEMPVQAECLRQAARHMEEREQTLADEIDTLRAQLAAAKVDAERYRYLRDGSDWPAVFARHDAPEPLRGAELDALIDAALRGEVK